MTEATITPALIQKHGFRPGHSDLSASSMMRRVPCRNVASLMPHPERACEPLPGSDDGKWIFESIFAALKNKTVAQAA